MRGRTASLRFFSPFFASLGLFLATLLGLLAVLRIRAVLTSLGPLALTVHGLLFQARHAILSTTYGKWT